MSIEAYLDCSPQIGQRVFIHESAVVIGRVTLADDVSLWPQAVARGDVNDISIGARSNIQDGSVLHVTHDGPYTAGGMPLTIGEDVTVGHMAMLHACDIGDRCLIGMSTVVMDGAILGDDVFLAAGSLVPPGRELESASLYRGSPAERIRSLTKTDLEMLRYSAEHYVRLKDRYIGTSAG